MKLLEVNEKMEKMLDEIEELKTLTEGDDEEVHSKIRILLVNFWLNRQIQEVWKEMQNVSEMCNSVKHIGNSPWTA